jgi:hypothetical protein
MPSIHDFPARGKIIEVKNGSVVFQPSNTNYQIWLNVENDFKPELSKHPIECFIRVNARKVYTVPSGGNFIQPIFGPPRILQGRVRYADERTIVVHAGVPVIVDLPAADSAIDLAEGKIQVGRMANVVALAGATLQLAGASVDVR